MSNSSDRQAPDASALRTDDLRGAYWSTLKGAAPRKAMTLENSLSASPVDFHLYGMRLAQRMIKPFERFGTVDPAWAEVVEIGCGMGRFVLPMACRFKHVHGLDISPEIIETARQYCAAVPNTSFHVNDGQTLAAMSGGSVDYCYSGGVFQHITYFEVIAGYIREAFRILKPGGVFLFFIQVWQIDAVGRGRIGAKITAGALDAAMADLPYEILELVFDPQDSTPHMMIVTRKTAPSDSAAPGVPAKQSFRDFPVTQRDIRTGIFEDLPACAAMRDQWGKSLRRVTFYDEV